MTTPKPTTDETCPDCGRELNASDECPWVAAQREEIADHNMLTTKPTSAESPERIAELADIIESHCNQSLNREDALSRIEPILVAALQAERERGDKLDAELDQYRREGIESAFPNLWARISELQAKLVTERERALEEAAALITEAGDNHGLARAIRSLKERD